MSSVTFQAIVEVLTYIHEKGVPIAQAVFRDIESPEFPDARFNIRVHQYPSSYLVSLQGGMPNRPQEEICDSRMGHHLDTDLAGIPLLDRLLEMAHRLYPTLPR